MLGLSATLPKLIQILQQHGFTGSFCATPWEYGFGSSGIPPYHRTAASFAVPPYDCVVHRTAVPLHDCMTVPWYHRTTYPCVGVPLCHCITVASNLRYLCGLCLFPIAADSCRLYHRTTVPPYCCIAGNSCVSTADSCLLSAAGFWVAAFIFSKPFEVSYRRTIVALCTAMQCSHCCGCIDLYFVAVVGCELNCIALSNDALSNDCTI